MRVAVVIGSTGLVGQFLVDELAQDGTWGLVLSVQRKAHPWKNPKIRGIHFDYEKWGDLELQIKSFAGTSAVDFFCCLGTTIRAAGSQENFKRVDFEYVFKFGELANACRAQQLLVVSAVGSSVDSSAFYSRVKGEMETSIEKIFHGTLHFSKPSLLLSHRSEFRFAERLAILVSPLISWALTGNLAKYRPISAHIVAKSMALVAAKKASANKFIFGQDMQEIIRRFQL